MNNQGTTNNNNEITEEGMNLGTSSSNDEGMNLGTNSSNDEATLMDSSGTTSNNNEITEEGTTNNNNDIKEGMNSTSNNNGISEDHVTVFVAYDGKWKWEGNYWLFKDARGSTLLVSKHVTLSEIKDILCKKLYGFRDPHLKLEVRYGVGFPIMSIDCDEDISLFISKSSKTELLLCVTSVFKDDVAGGVEKDGTNPDIKKESPHGCKDDKVENKLIKAIRKEDWVKAREIVNKEDVTWTSKLDDEDNTAFHLAVGRYKDNKVVREILMGIDSEELLTTVDIDGRNPAHIAANFGNTEALEIMLDSNPKCLFTPDNYDLLAIHSAHEISVIETFLYLFKQMKRYKVEYDILFRGMRGLKLLHQVIDLGLIDVAYELISYYPSLATTVYRDKTALECIIRKPELFYSGTSYSFYSRFVYHNVPNENNSFGSTDTADVENQETPKKDKFVTMYRRRCLHNVILRIYFKLWETTLWHVPYVEYLKYCKVRHDTTIKLLRLICVEANRTYTESDIERLYSSSFCLAVENNNPEVVDVLTTYFAGLLYNSKKDGRNIYQLTVLNRSEKVFRYILHHERFGKSGFAVSLDDDENNILHLAGHLAPRHKLTAASGAALQMQQELQWFQEVKKVVGIEHTQALNKNKETPMMVFRREHMELRKDGEEWIKRTADSYIVTAALIIAICFAAAITVPGGNDSATGKPINESKASLIIFAISDAISLFTSTTSLMFFLSVIPARYADEDFLYKLLNRLFVQGLLMLFVSLTSMMIAFSAALYIMFGQGKTWILIPIVALACLPIASVVVQFPLLAEIISSIYGQGIFGNENYYRQSSANANKNKRTWETSY